MGKSAEFYAFKIGNALTESGERLGTVMDQAIAGFNQAKDGIVQAFNALSAARAQAASAGFLTEQGKQVQASLEIQAIRAALQEVSFVNNQAVEQAIRSALQNGTDLQALASIRQTLTTLAKAEDDSDKATKDLAEANKKLYTASLDLTTAINDFRREINISVTAPQGTAVSSNIPVNYS
jgi:hypothetical protein